MKVAVIGGGLQGACVAFEFAARGVQVDLYDRNPAPMSESSAYNEGKVHLGYVYAQDTSLATASLMASGALAFQPLLKSWLGPEIDSLPVSHAFRYAVHRESLISADEFEHHCMRTVEATQEFARKRPWQYFGRDPLQSPRRLTSVELSSGYAHDRILAAYETQEIAIDPLALAGLVRTRLASTTNIRCFVGHDVRGLSTKGEGIRVHAVAAENERHCIYDFVVNAAWSGRLPLDRDMGFHPPGQWSFRLKYFLRAHAPNSAATLPSTTMVLGPFGDVVNYGNGQLYLSWYPAGLSAWSFDLEPPRTPFILQGDESAAVESEILLRLKEVVPQIGKLDIIASEVTGGWIFAEGVTDVDDKGSGLHDRSHAGIHRAGRYLSIDTGKLTLAPYFAESIVASVLTDV